MLPRMFSCFRFLIKMWTFHMTILIVGYISGAYTYKCPEEEDISPCKCKDRYWFIDVKCSSSMFADVHDSENVRQSLRSLAGKNSVHLILKGFDFSIPSNFFSGIGIDHLTFQSFPTIALTLDDQPGLLGLEDHLKVLTISGTSMLPKLNLSHLKKLEVLALYESKINELGDDWFSEGPSSLEDLFIERCNITNIGSNAFSQLNNLQDLRLKDNRFGPIERSMLPGTADKLYNLDLENNALTDLPEDIFTGMPHIDRISLAGNRITTLDERTWSPVWQSLSSVDIRRNKIVCDERLDWISKVRRPWVYGKCSAPKLFKGMQLEEFFKR